MPPKKPAKRTPSKETSKSQAVGGKGGGSTTANAKRKGTAKEKDKKKPALVDTDDDEDEGEEEDEPVINDSPPPPTTGPVTRLAAQRSRELMPPPTQLKGSNTSKTPKAAAATSSTTPMSLTNMPRQEKLDRLSKTLEERKIGELSLPRGSVSGSARGSVAPSTATSATSAFMRIGRADEKAKIAVENVDPTDRFIRALAGDSNHGLQPAALLAMCEAGRMSLDIRHSYIQHVGVFAKLSSLFMRGVKACAAAENELDRLALEMTTGEIYRQQYQSGILLGRQTESLERLEQIDLRWNNILRETKGETVPYKFSES